MKAGFLDEKRLEGSLEPVVFLYQSFPISIGVHGQILQHAHLFSDALASMLPHSLAFSAGENHKRG
ncbi:hypothetical protein [Atrimonas thermophila]|uniref:hypothetical protein n=1 Tax=Atrimonas thermophila TaxID=3064161 RepID=UPI00399CAA02